MDVFGTCRYLTRDSPIVEGWVIAFHSHLGRIVQHLQKRSKHVTVIKAEVKKLVPAECKHLSRS